MFTIENKVASIAFKVARETYTYGVRNDDESIMELAKRHMTEIIYHNGRNSKENRVDNSYEERT